MDICSVIMTGPKMDWEKMWFQNIILVNELHLAYVLWNQNSEKKQQPFVDLIVFVVVCIVLYLMHKPKVFTDFLMIDVMELLFLIELICTIFIDLTLSGKKSPTSKVVG